MVPDSFLFSDSFSKMTEAADLSHLLTEFRVFRLTQLNQIVHSE